MVDLYEWHQQQHAPLPGTLQGKLASLHSLVDVCCVSTDLTNIN